MSLQDLSSTRPGIVREARPADVPEMLRLIRELAVYEREPDAVKTRESDLEAALFGERPTAFAHVVDAPDEGPDGRLAGIALWFLTFSTWEGVNGIHLEDLYVSPEHRGSGLGTRLLTALAELCVQRGYARLEWSVLTWNEPSIGFYRSLGAEDQSEWMMFRLAGDALRTLGKA